MRTMITTVVNLPPLIIQHYNEYFLRDLPDRLMLRVEEQIKILAVKKIRAQDIGKKRDFDNLLKQFYEVYERKKIEKAIYDAEIKEKREKVPRISATEGTMHFRRIQPCK